MQVECICSGPEPCEDPRLSESMLVALSPLDPVRSSEVTFFISTEPWSQWWWTLCCSTPYNLVSRLSFLSQFCSGKLSFPPLLNANLMGITIKMSFYLWSRGRVMIQVRSLEAFFWEADSWTETDTRSWPFLMMVLRRDCPLVLVPEVPRLLWTLFSTVYLLIWICKKPNNILSPFTFYLN